MKLVDQIQDPQIKADIAQDCIQFIEEFMATKKGLGGLTFKTVYKALNGVKPNYIEDAIQRLLPDVVTALEPLWQQGTIAGNPVTYLNDNADETADVILSVTDDRLKRSSNKIIIASYKQVRKSVKPEIIACVPGLSQILSKYIQV